MAEDEWRSRIEKCMARANKSDNHYDYGIGDHNQGWPDLLETLPLSFKLQLFFTKGLKTSCCSFMTIFRLSDQVRIFDKDNQFQADYTILR